MSPRGPRLHCPAARTAQAAPSAEQPHFSACPRTGPPPCRAAGATCSAPGRMGPVVKECCTSAAAWSPAAPAPARGRPGPAAPGAPRLQRQRHPRWPAQSSAAARQPAAAGTARHPGWPPCVRQSSAGILAGVEGAAALERTRITPSLGTPAAAAAGAAPPPGPRQRCTAAPGAGRPPAAAPCGRRWPHMTRAGEPPPARAVQPLRPALPCARAEQHQALTCRGSSSADEKDVARASSISACWAAGPGPASDCARRALLPASTCTAATALAPALLPAPAARGASQARHTRCTGVEGPPGQGWAWAGRRARRERWRARRRRRADRPWVRCGGDRLRGGRGSAPAWGASARCCGRQAARGMHLRPDLRPAGSPPGLEGHVGSPSRQGGASMPRQRAVLAAAMGLRASSGALVSRPAGPMLTICAAERRAQVPSTALVLRRLLGVLRMPAPLGQSSHSSKVSQPGAGLVPACRLGSLPHLRTSASQARATMTGSTTVQAASIELSPARTSRVRLPPPTAAEALVQRPVGADPGLRRPWRPCTSCWKRSTTSSCSRWPWHAPGPAQPQPRGGKA